jgi:hypothetical protein
MFFCGFRGHKIYLSRVAVLLLLVSPTTSQAGDILASSVNHEGNRYTLSVTARIDAPLDAVYRSITDFDNLAAINPAIEESQLLAILPPDTRRVRSIIRVCILMFCKQVEQVQDVTLLADHAIEAVIVPERSDFRSGIARWQLTDRGASTELVFSNRFEPDFWVPPVIGSWLIRRKLVWEVAESARHIEVTIHAAAQ